MCGEILNASYIYKGTGCIDANNNLQNGNSFVGGFGGKLHYFLVSLTQSWTPIKNHDVHIFCIYHMYMYSDFSLVKATLFPSGHATPEPIGPTEIESSVQGFLSQFGICTTTSWLV